MRVTASAHSWIFPVVTGLAGCVGVFQALTGIRVGLGWPSNPTYIRVGGAVGAVIGFGLLAFWLLAIGP